MSMKPDEVPIELYCALIYIFNDMTTERKEKFIENSYIYVQHHKYNDDALDPGVSYVPSKDSNGSWDGQYEYKISNVFKQMVVINSAFLNSNNKVSNKYWSNYNIMYAIACLGDRVYVPGDSNAHGIQLSISRNKSKVSMNDDFTISFNGSTNMNDYHFFSIDVYKKRDGDSIDGVFDYHTRKLAQSLHISVFDKHIEGITSSVSAACDVLVSMLQAAGYLAEIPALASTTMTLIVGYCAYLYEANATNSTIDKINKLLEDGNTYKALAMEASFAIRDDGTYVITYFTVDKETLNRRLEAWKSDKNIDIDYNADDIIQALKTGNTDNLEQLDEFVTWYSSQNGATTSKKS